MHDFLPSQAHAAGLQWLSSEQPRTDDVGIGFSIALLLVRFADVALAATAAFSSDAAEALVVSGDGDGWHLFGLGR